MSHRDPVGRLRSYALPRRFGRTRALAAIAACLAGGPATAGAWTLPQGDGQVIAAATFSRGERYFDDKGKLIPEANYRKFDFPVLVEYGLTDRFTVIASPSFLHVEVGAHPVHSYQGLGYMDLGARLRLWTSGAHVISLQALGRIPGARNPDNPAELGWTQTETDLRALWGYAFDLGPWPAFVDAQIAYRSRGGGPADEIRLDLTLGARPHPRWLILLQSFNTISAGPAAGVFEETRSHKLAVSAAYTIGRWTLQAGGVTTLSGRNALGEHGLIGGLWYRF